MNMEKNSFFHDDVPLIQLTVGQMKNIIESVFQGMLSLKESIVWEEDVFMMQK
jgi:hypothetical protein